MQADRGTQDGSLSGRRLSDRGRSVHWTSILSGLGPRLTRELNTNGKPKVSITGAPDKNNNNKTKIDPTYVFPATSVLRLDMQ